MKLNRFLSISVAVFTVLSLAGCGTVQESFKAFDENSVYNALLDKTVASNDRLELLWNDSKKLVTLYDKENNCYWGTGSDADDKMTHPQVTSPIYISYFDQNAYTEKTAYAQVSAIKTKTVTAEKIKNGISVRYDFKTERISVTVDYILREDNLLVSIDKSKITESPEKVITSISLLPFLTSAQNGSENSYLFVPSGQGAIVYPEVFSNNVSNTSEHVYGIDYAVTEDYRFTNTQSVQLPVYGAKRGNNGLCAVIESDAQAASINTITNSKNMGYAAVYSSFMVRGYDFIDLPSGFGNGTTKTRLYSNAVNDTVAAVAFYPFGGENCSYIDMANIYREYLFEASGVDKDINDKNAIPLNLNIVGGVMTKTHFSGIPYRDVSVMTSLKAAREIIDKVDGILKGNFDVTLSGFTDTGLDVGKIAGGGKISRSFGSASQEKALLKYMSDNKISSYVDFNTNFFNEGGFGASVLSDAAIGVRGKRVSLTDKSLQTGFAALKAIPFRILAREKIDDVNHKIIDNASKKGYGGVSLSTLTNVSYSDFSQKKYNLSGGTQNQVSDILREYKKADIHVRGNAANDYAALLCDAISSVPVDSSNYDSYSLDVPFYQIVFKGYVPMNTAPLNYYTDSKIALLKAAESGIGISLAVSEDYDINLISSVQDINQILLSDEMAEYLDSIKESEYFGAFGSVKGATIVNHTIDGDLRITEFDNGVKIYVNYGDEDAKLDGMTVAAESFLVREGS